MLLHCAGIPSKAFKIHWEIIKQFKGFFESQILL